MAQLPPDGTWLIQQIDGEVVVFHRHTGDEVVRFDVADPDSFGPALKKIGTTLQLTPEQKSFAAFWTGYFYARLGAEPETDIEKEKS